MEANQLPTTSGQHWFKEEGTEDWQPYYVTTLDGKGMICHCSEHNVTSRCQVSEMPGGQWAKAHKPDEGVDYREAYPDTFPGRKGVRDEN